MDRFRRRVSAEENVHRLERALSGWTSTRRSSPARADPNDGSDTADDSKGPLGLNLIHDVTEPSIDFVFVHGLGGGSRKTWSKSSNPYHYWPKEWLATDPEFGCVRIHSFGYKADWSEWSGSLLDIHDFALMLLGEMEHSPCIRRSNTKIVLVAHSMGGLVVKKAYLLARENPSLKVLADRIHTLYFLATPHRGSELAKTLVNIMKISYGQKTFVTEVIRNSETIMSINDSFRHFAEDVQLWSFYETMPSNLVLTNTIIVDKASATLGYAREHISLLNADHRGICKFDCPNEPNYKTLRNAFITTIDTILSERSQLNSAASRERYSRLVNLTGTNDFPIDDLAALEDLCIEGSCQWLTSKDNYTAWRTPWSESRPIFCLTGNAGAGKSVTSSQIINDLKRHNAHCSYFFFKHGESAESVIAGCLRALAFQMAKSDEAVMQQLLDIEQGSVPCVNWDERVVWRKLFLESIFRISKPLPQYWVIDALDECPGFSVLLNMIAKAPPHLRVFFTGRPNIEIEQSIKLLSSNIERHQLSSQDTTEDLNSLINSRMDRLPIGDGNSQKELKEKLLAKSSGSFLWLSLILQELKCAYTDESAEEILNEVPEDMNKLYTRMLGGLNFNGRAMTLTKSVFMWTLFSVRTLTIDEMQSAIKLDINQTLQNLARSVPGICGQLVIVDQVGRIRCIHQTAQKFLLQQDEFPALSMSSQESHTKMALVCLKVLAADQESRSAKSWADLRSGGLDMKIVDYACHHFSDHLHRCSTQDSAVWHFLCQFLDRSVSLWIEYLAMKGKLYVMVKTAKHLREYLKRRLKQMNPISAGKGKLESWIKDIVKLCTKFRTSLALSPSSIHTIIPAICPAESNISFKNAHGRSVITVKGLSCLSWDDCLAVIDYPRCPTCAVALSDLYLAVATSDGKIYLYHGDSLQMKCIFSHGGRAKTLVFINDCAYLASAGLCSIKVWELRSQTQVLAFDTSSPVIGLSSPYGTSTLVAATIDNYLSIWDIQQRLEKDRWHWPGAAHESRSRMLSRAPGKAMLSSENNFLAVCYRGLPIYIFDNDTRVLLGYCSRSKTTNPMEAVDSPVDALCFNSGREINVLAVSYGDGDLCIFDLRSMQLRHRRSRVFASTIVCSPDGRALLVGNLNGDIEIFEFCGVEGERLSLIHKIRAHEDDIRSMAFSDDGLRFADIRESQCRVWEPSALVRSDTEDGTRSERSVESIPLLSQDILTEEVQGSKISAFCEGLSGDFIFCGCVDGSVAYYEVQEATCKGFINRSTSNIGITCIACTGKNILITADESGRLLIMTIGKHGDALEVVCPPIEIHSDEPIKTLLTGPSGDRVLLYCSRSVSLWTVAGEQVGSAIVLRHEDETIVRIHPVRTDYFLIIGKENIRVFSWTDGLELSPFPEEKIGDLTIQVTPYSPKHVQVSHFSDLLGINKRPDHAGYIAALIKSDGGPTSPKKLPASATSLLKVWPGSSITDFSPCFHPEALHDPGNVSHRISQIIAVDGSKLYFLDTDHWVCSLTLDGPTLSAETARRHFFLLSEWQNDFQRFDIIYLPTRRDFAIASRGRLGIVKRGLDVEEQWLPL